VFPPDCFWITRLTASSPSSRLLLLDHQAHRLVAVQAAQAALLLPAVADRRHVPNPRDRLAAGGVVAHGHDQVAVVLPVLDAPHDARVLFTRAGRHLAAGELDVLVGERPPHVLGRHLAALQLVGLERLAADEHDLADAEEAFEVFLDLPLGDLGDLADVAAAAHHDRHDRRGVEVEALDLRRVGADGERRQDGGHLVADVLGRGLAVPLQLEADDDDGDALLRGAPQLVDPGDGVDRLLDRLGDRRLHLLDAGPLEGGGDDDDGHVHVREQLDAEARVRREPEHHRPEDEHGGEHGAADADVPNRHVRLSQEAGRLATKRHETTQKESQIPDWIQTLFCLPFCVISYLFVAICRWSWFTAGRGSRCRPPTASGRS
jgi:hypothetical protein